MNFKPISKAYLCILPSLLIFNCLQTSNKLSETSFFDHKEFAPEDTIKTLEGKIILNLTEFDFCGNEIYPDFHLEGPIADLDWWYMDLSYVNNHYPGTASVRIEGRNGYEGVISADFTINKIICPEDWLEYSIPDEDITYDGETHEAWIADIDGTGGKILSYIYNGNPTSETPKTPGDYEVFMEYLDGPGVYAVPKRKIGQFSIYELNDDDWKSLLALSEELSKQNDINTVWSSPLTADKTSAARLQWSELIFSEGKIKNIYLSSKYLKGDLPLSAFRFKHAEYIDLQNNLFSGPIDRLAALKEIEPDAMNSVKTLWLADNLLTGNAGVLSLFPNLEFISIERNRISDVVPMIAPDKYFYYADQDLGIEMTVDLRDFKLEGIVDKVPSIAFYNHDNQSYVQDDLRLYVSDSKDWNIELILANGYPEPFTSYNSNVFTGGQGETLDAAIMPNNCKGKIKFWFKPGDVDFNGLINILDVQSAISYILDTRYHPLINDPRHYDPVNFTAANLFDDDIINVQDLVRLVDLILDTNPLNQGVRQSIARYAKESSMNDTEDTTASVYIENGNLIISSDSEVAAFDVIVDAPEVTTISIPGFVTTKKSYDGKTRVIGYSISGASLKEGVVCIGSTTTSEVDFAMLSDTHAKEIPAALNADTTGVSIIESENFLTIASNGIHLALREGSNASWQICTADGMTVHSGSAYAGNDGIIIPFNAEQGRIYIISVNCEGKTTHKKIIKN